MKTKFVAVIGLIAASLAFSGESLFAQSNSNYNKKTPWGDPDLQGMWSYASLTPLQRSSRLGDKEFYTAEEAEEIYAATQREPVDLSLIHI